MLDIPDMPELPEGIDPLEVTKAIAAASLPSIMQSLAYRALDDRTSTSNVVAIAEHMHKASGAARLEQKSDQGRFIFNIQFSGVGKQPMVIDCAPVGDEEFLSQPQPSMSLPTFLRNTTDNLSSLLDDVDG